MRVLECSSPFSHIWLAFVLAAGFCITLSPTFSTDTDHCACAGSPSPSTWRERGGAGTGVSCGRLGLGHYSPIEKRGTESHVAIRKPVTFATEILHPGVWLANSQAWERKISWPEKVNKAIVVFLRLRQMVECRCTFSERLMNVCDVPSSRRYCSLRYTPILTSHHSRSSLCIYSFKSSQPLYQCFRYFFVSCSEHPQMLMKIATGICYRSSCSPTLGIIKRGRILRKRVFLEPSLSTQGTLLFINWKNRNQKQSPKILFFFHPDGDLQCPSIERRYS